MNTQKSAIKIISPTIHGILDYVVVLFLLIAPSIFPAMPPALKVVVYVLAVIYLALTVLTRFSVGIFELIPLKAHALIELLIAIALVASPWILAFADNAFARNFVIIFGIALFVIWLLTDFGLTQTQEEAEAGADDGTTSKQDDKNETQEDPDASTEAVNNNHPSTHA